MKPSNLPGKHFIVLVILGLIFFSVGVYSVQVTVIQSPSPETATPPATQTPTPAPTTTAEKVITIQFPSLTPEAPSNEVTTISQSDNVPKLTKITYNSQIIFENEVLSDVRMDPSSGTLTVVYVPIKDANYYSFEIWALTAQEAKDFNSWTVEKKNGLRQFQFILKQGEMQKNQSSHTVAVALSGLVDQSKTKWYPDRNKARCDLKYNWVSDASSGANCDGNVNDQNSQISKTWSQFTFQKYYEYVKKYDNGKRFYLVVENSTNPNDSSKWVDSMPIPLIIGDVPPQAQPTGKCKTIVECKAIIDKGFVDDVFKKKI